MQRRDVAPKGDVLLLNNNKEKFDAIVERVKKNTKNNIQILLNSLFLMKMHLQFAV